MALRPQSAAGKARKASVCSLVPGMVDVLGFVAAFKHPSIARMLDAGETADGSPYLAMELIRGLPITGYCDARKLDARGRVEVFLRVCEAVQHAHANLVLHRDLKPSNVLVDEHGNPKLIDFGIAKPFTLVSDDEYQQTATAHRFFSPNNAAPEQLRGQRIGVACDVYQLGTLLYELLCGKTVFDTTGLTPGQLEQRILGVAPEALSARAGRVSDAIAQAHGVTTPAALARALRGDLDAIVALALRKPPQERYGSVEQLADDLRRCLDGRPVVALRGRRWYRARKFLRRHALAVGVSTAAVVLVVVFVTALWLQSQRIASERNLAQQRSNEVEQVARFEGDMLKQVDPTMAGKQLMDDLQAKFVSALVKDGVPESERAGQVATLAALLQHVNATDAARDQIDRTILKPAIAAIDKQFRSQPVVAATLRQVLADRYVEMGMYDAALPLQTSVLAMRRRLLGGDNQDTLQSISGMGELLDRQDKQSEAEPFFREALEKRRRVLGEEHPDTVESIGSVGALLFEEGKLDKAEPYLREALTKSRRVNGEDSKETLVLIGDLGSLLGYQGKLSEAEPLLREAVEKMRRVLGEDNRRTLATIGDLGWTLRLQGKLSAAEIFLREAMDKSRRDLGEEHGNTLEAITRMALLLEAQGKQNAAEPYFREELEKSRRVLGEQSRDTLFAIGNLASDLEDQGKLSEAEPMFREKMEKARREQGDDNSDTLFAIDDLGRILLHQGKLTDAEPYMREALQTSRRVLGEKDLATQYAVSQMGALLVAQGKYAEAEKLLTPSEVETRRGGTSYDAYIRSMILMNLGRARTGLGEFAGAETDLLQAQPGIIASGSPKDIETHPCTQAIVDLYTAWNIAQPGNGYDAKATEWKRKLRELDAPTSAASRKARKEARVNYRLNLTLVHRALQAVHVA
jgi:tetratricopeptide (TPR) repeat protein